MKKIFNIAIIALSLAAVSSCDEGFDALNKSKTGATAVDPVATFNNAVIFTSPQAGTIQYETGAVQQLITSNSGVNVGANFNQVNVGATPAAWTNFYQNVIKYSADVIAVTKSDPARTNLYNMARIIQQYGFMVLTDTYGDIPYSDAGKAYTNSLFFPKYDAQSVVYDGIIAEITSAVAALDPASRVETSDVLYAGDITKWRRFGNSLLLRAGMRLVNKNAAKAASTAAAAFGGPGGVILTNADNAVIRHDANYLNGVGNTLNGTEAANFFLAKPFVDALKANSDPRLTSIAVRVPGARSGPDQVDGANYPKDFTAANQYGMPMGSTDATANTAGAALPPGGNVPRTGNLFSFSQADRQRVTSRSSPMFLVTAAMTNFLLAEALERGFAGITGTSTAYFDAGIKASMDQMASYSAASAISASARDTYAAARAVTFAAAPAGPANVDSPTGRVTLINYEYWVATFLNGNEGWANFRRVALEQRLPSIFVTNPYSGKTVDWINRITYPPSESLVNTANYQAAVQAMGGTDGLGTKVYWAK
jgi:hypothetical protein